MTKIRHYHYGLHSSAEQIKNITLGSIPGRVINKKFFVMFTARLGLRTTKNTAKRPSRKFVPRPINHRSTRSIWIYTHIISITAKPDRWVSIFSAENLQYLWKGQDKTKVTNDDQQEVTHALSIGAKMKINDPGWLEGSLRTLFQDTCVSRSLLRKSEWKWTHTISDDDVAQWL